MTKMGSGLSGGEKIDPQQLVRQNYDRSTSDSNDNFRTTKRTCTDVCFLLIFIIFQLGLLCALFYCIYNGDIFREINGYDNCGNVCDREPIVTDDQTRENYCKPAPNIMPPYHIVLRVNDTFLDRRCVQSCYEYKGYEVFLLRCVPKKSYLIMNTLLATITVKNFFSELADDFYVCCYEFLYMCIIALVLSLLLMLLLRYLVGFVVWIIMIGAALVCLLSSVMLWFMWNNSTNYVYTFPFNLVPDMDSRNNGTYLAIAITLTIVTVMVISVIVAMRKQIALVVQLFNEAGKSIIKMPWILIQPIIAFILLMGVFTLWFYFYLWIESAGRLAESPPKVYYYEKDSLMKATRWYNIAGMLWMCQFIGACQNMTIAGAVSDWYFHRNKRSLHSPILKSICHLVCFHLGSVALGSLAITVVQMFRLAFNVLHQFFLSHKGRCIQCSLGCCHCCLFLFEKALKFVTRQAYIEIAVHGHSFCQGARNSFQLLANNTIPVTAVNSVGDFVLFLAKVLVVATTVAIGSQLLKNKTGLHHMGMLLVLAAIFGYIIANCFIGLYEMAIDTIFLCFCKDCEQNDGMSRPYYMSKGLMEFVESSKKTSEKHLNKKRSDQIRKQEILPGPINKKP